MHCKKLRNLLLVILPGILLISGITSGKENKSQLFISNKVIVKPAEKNIYIDAAKKEKEYLLDYKYPYPSMVYSTDDNCFYYFTPINNFAEVDSIVEIFNEIEKKDPEGFKEMLETANGTFEYMRQSFCFYRPDLSINNKNPEFPEHLGNTRIWDIHYVKPGMNQQYESIVKELKYLADKNNASQMWNIYYGTIGNEQPVYFGIGAAKNMSEFYDENNKMWEKLGEEGSQLYDKLMHCIRKREIKSGFYRKDLSYFPDNEDTQK